MAARIELRNHIEFAVPTACCSTEGRTQVTVMQGHAGPPESVARSMLSKGFPRNLGNTSLSPWNDTAKVVKVRPTERNLAPVIRDVDGAGRDECEHPRGYLDSEGQPQEYRDGQGGGLRVRSTDEGGELQGSQQWGGHRSHWREGTNRITHRLGETRRLQEVDEPCQRKPAR